MIPKDPEQLFLSELAYIERAIRFACVRASLSEADTEDFASLVKVRLIENDYAILRKYEGRSKFHTYINIVIHHLLLDYRKHEWGRWHPSAEARRLGDVAVEVEQLLLRDGRTLDETLMVINNKYPSITREEIERMAEHFPWRQQRRMVDFKYALDEMQVAPREFAPERQRTAEQLSTVVRAFLENLPDEDRLTFQLRFVSSMTIAQIARMTHREQKPLYRRLDKLTSDLRQSLKAAGIETADVLELLSKNPELLDFQWKRTDPKQETS